MLFGWCVRVSLSGHEVKELRDKERPRERKREGGLRLRRRRGTGAGAHMRGAERRHQQQPRVGWSDRNSCPTASPACLALLPWFRLRHVSSVPRNAACMPLPDSFLSRTLARVRTSPPEGNPWWASARSWTGRQKISFICSKRKITPPEEQDG